MGGDKNASTTTIQEKREDEDELYRKYRGLQWELDENGRYTNQSKSTDGGGNISVDNEEQDGEDTPVPDVNEVTKADESRNIKVPDEVITQEHLHDYIENEILKCYKSFNFIGDSELSIMEIKSGFQFFGLDDVTTEEIVALIDEFSDERREQLSFFDFHRTMYDVMMQGTTEEHLKMVFDLMDTKKDGWIGPKQIITLFEKIGFSLSMSEVIETMSEIDVQGTGVFDYPQFKTFCLEHDPLMKIKDKLCKTGS